MFLRHYLLQAKERNSVASDWTMKVDESRQASFHYFLVHIPQVDYIRVSDVLQSVISSEALNHELYKLRNKDIF